jgi:hypothetical protein
MTQTLYAHMNKKNKEIDVGCPQSLAKWSWAASSEVARHWEHFLLTLVQHSLCFITFHVFCAFLHLNTE